MHAPARETVGRLWSVALLVLVLGCVDGDSVNTVNRSARRAVSRGGDQYVLVFLGGAGCGMCNTPDLPGMVRAVVDSVSTYASTHGKQFSSIGVSLDWSLPVGMEYLEGIHTFDEVIIGSNWLNTGVVRYVWRDLPGQPSIPQVIVLERTIQVGESTFTVGPEQVLTRAIGVEQISEFSTARFRP